MPWHLNRFQHTGQSHFVTFCCYHRRPLLTTDASRRVFENALERVRHSHRLYVYGYVIMPEHIHLLLSEPNDGGPLKLEGGPLKPGVGLSGDLHCLSKRHHRTLADALKSLKQGVSRRLIGEAAHFWQKRYYDFNVSNHAQFVEKLHYIHWNPVRKGLCERPEDWPWSNFSITQRAARDELKSSPNGPRANASEQRERSVRPLHFPTQAKIRLEWATRPEASGARRSEGSSAIDIGHPSHVILSVAAFPAERRIPRTPKSDAALILFSATHS